jgi:hypothetical protein
LIIITSANYAHDDGFFVYFVKRILKRKSCYELGGFYYIFIKKKLGLVDYAFSKIEAENTLCHLSSIFERKFYHTSKKNKVKIVKGT